MFSTMFWNVENFGRSLDPDEPNEEEFIQRVDQVEAHIRSLDPDMLCLSEIQDKVALRNLLMNRLIQYDFAVTDGRGHIELVTGWKRKKFEQVLFTQRREFQASSSYMRPGALINVKFKGEFFSFLFLHTDSGREDKDYRNRQIMFQKIWNLKESLDEINKDDANFVVMGDLNTMGRQGYRSIPSLSRISAEQEIAALAEDAEANGMRMLPKTHDLTWRKGPCDPDFESNLDHVLATSNISFISPKVSVNGWNHLTGEERDDFSENVSDHCSLFCKIRCE